MKFSLNNIPLQKTKFLLAGIGTVSFLVVIIILAFKISGPSIPQPPPEPPPPPGADQQIKVFHYVSTDAQGAKQWELKADKVNYFHENKMAGFEQVHITFYSRKQDGRVFTIRSDTGLLNTETQDFELTGNVVGTTSDGYKFRTESLNYTADKHQARTDKKVFLEGEEFDLEGIGMVMNLQEEKFHLLKNVVAKGKK